jgi:predicted RNA-binding Zn-ribbon protein involved in translation (DUF1610 family)
MFKCAFNKKNNEVDIELLAKIYICKVCGNQFDLIKENKYVVQENNGLNGAVNGRKKYECFDCPTCGCQNIVNIREG